MKNQDLILRKILDKANQAFMQNYSTHTDFLDLYQQNIFLSHVKELPTNNYKLLGGYQQSERKVAVFYPDYLNNLDSPIQVVKIEPLNSNFAEKLGHRDYLGALMNLGIHRNKLGDLIIEEDHAYVFCLDPIPKVIIDSLVQVRNTSVFAKIDEERDFSTYRPTYTIINGTVSSLRIDNTIKLAFSLSREQASQYVQSGKVFINSQLIDKNSISINMDDLISVRGLGKFQLKTIGHQTRKGRIFIELQKY